jgi:hypothetical protein
MKKKSLIATLLSAAALLVLLVPDRLNGQAAGEDAALAAVLTEITAQQATIAENQAKIDEKIAAIAEDIRIAKIYVGRGGGKAK